MCVCVLLLSNIILSSFLFVKSGTWHPVVTYTVRARVRRGDLNVGCIVLPLLRYCTAILGKGSESWKRDNNPGGWQILLAVCLSIGLLVDCAKCLPLAYKITYSMRWCAVLQFFPLPILDRKGDDISDDLSPLFDDDDDIMLSYVTWSMFPLLFKSVACAALSSVSSFQFCYVSNVNPF